MQERARAQDVTASTASHTHTRVSLWLLGGLLFLRFPFLTALGVLYPRGHRPGWLLPVFIGGTYLLTAILIWWERERLREFWIDLSSAIVFLCQMFCFPIGIGLFLGMWRSRARFPKPPPGLWRWVLIGAFLGIGIQLCSLLLHLNPGQPRSGYWQPNFGTLFLLAAVQATNAGVFEEPLFRGFLWGYLRLARWKDGWILLFQAALFTLGHVYYLRDEEFALWLARLLLPSLVIGFVAWRARSITASMVTHGFINGSGDVLMHAGSETGAIRTALTAMASIAVLFLCSMAVRRWRCQVASAAGRDPRAAPGPAAP